MLPKRVSSNLHSRPVFWLPNWQTSLYHSGNTLITINSRLHSRASICAVEQNKIEENTTNKPTCCSSAVQGCVWEGTEHDENRSKSSPRFSSPPPITSRETGKSCLENINKSELIFCFSFCSNFYLESNKKLIIYSLRKVSRKLFV